jgi:simple sugar transport system ATP-binding protein
VLYRGARILVLDEPTAVLTAQESLRLLEMVRAFVERGEDHAAVIITHKLDEVLAVSDRIVVLRRGERVLEAARGTESAQSLADAMVGRHVELPRRREGSCAATGAAPALEVRALEVRGPAGTLALRGVSLAVAPGEILGIAGVDGNGQAELVAAIAGLALPERGTVWLGGRDVTSASVAARQRLGLSVVHEDRQVRGLVLAFSLAENFALGRLDEWTRRGFVDRAALWAATDEGMRRLDVRASGVEALAGTLSGGNQQKVVLARELGRAHVALVAAQPTRGVDVGAVEVIRKELLAERAAGRAVLLVSADLAELRALCDRVAVLYRGRLQGVVPVDEATDERLGRWMTGATEAEPEVAGAAR